MSDQKAGQPYILHPLRLMMRETETEKIVAVPHEVVAGSQKPQHWGFDELRGEGLSESMLEGVTRREGETYEEFMPFADRSSRPAG